MRPEARPAPHPPERTCIGCRGKKTAAELVRIVQDASGSVELGAGRSGRGAWLCKGDGTLVDLACFDLAVRRQAFRRAFRSAVADDAITGLRAKAGKRARMDGRG